MPDALRKDAHRAATPLALLLAALVFTSDLLVPLGSAHAVLYIPVVVATLWSRRRRDSFLAAGLCTVLGLIPLVLLQERDGDALVNRALSILAIWAVAIGVRGRWAVERALREREAQMKAIVTTAVDGIITIDERGAIASLNPAALRMFGYREDELLGRNVRMLMPSPYREDHDGYLSRYMSTGQARIIGVGREVVGLRKDGSVFPLDLAVGEWSDRTRMFTGILRDLTERQRLEEEFRQAQRLEAVGRLAGGIAHDFNNLLMGVGGCARAALATAGPEAREQLEEIRSAVDRGAALTRQLLAFGRREELAPEPTLVDELIERLETMLARLLGEDVELRVELNAGGGPIVAGPMQVEQVLMNLAVNARDAMPEGGRLDVRTRLETCDEAGVAGAGGVGVGSYVALEVADDGCGMPPDVRDRAFDPFFTTKPSTEGSGLGLSTVYGIVRQLGGHLHLSSEVGRGTTLVAHLPVAEFEVAPSIPPEPARDPEPDGDRGTLLLVEDDRLVRAALRSMLERQGHTVLLAGNGVDALRVCEEHRGRIDLLLTDILMPGMGGGEVASEVSARRPGIRVLFMSALPNDVLVKQGRLAEGQPSIQKPFDEDELVARLREVLAP